MIIAAILRHKQGEIITVSPSAPLSEVVALLATHRIGAAPVSGGGGLDGIISERDIIRALAQHGAGALTLKVGDTMTRSVQTTTPDATVEQAMAAMTAGRFRHLPVMEQGRMTAIISIGDVVKALLTEQAYEVENLRSYVAGGS
ncbi:MULTISPECIES: CBS domain-containing protein [unclassified Acidisoma]|uniref:CBS domain-containing protein n=1 Tax=unclassified Acidisoma TaxID=2634065 RepID=UPI00131EAC94|nr:MULTISPECIES: CBS domain-containing protein [unclassified Acidisoma]